MVLLLLKIKAELENITDLVPKGPSDGSADFTFFLKVKCGNCGHESEKYSALNASRQVDIPKSRGTAHLVQKCKMCDRVGSISLIEGRGKPYKLEDSEAERYVEITCLDCRGVEAFEFIPRDGWAARGLTGSEFNDIDLSEGEFAEYDEKASTSVGIYNMEHIFETTKQIK